MAGAVSIRDEVATNRPTQNRTGITRLSDEYSTVEIWVRKLVKVFGRDTYIAPDHWASPPKRWKESNLLSVKLQYKSL